MWPRRPEEEVPITAPAPPQSLNKYKVLPSIERRRSEQSSLDNDMSVLTLSDPPDAEGEPPGIGPGPPPPDPPGGSLLLAVRAPCGRRFQRQFAAADTLLAVKVSAEARYGDEYGGGVSIETADVPRRSFTDMDMTLAQCGVVDRSVLCITRDHDGVRPLK
ncbi:putative UBX domain-containing protein 10 [Scophthalmus maximus]|nr:putative UBX domain-containing protein 10 [Scophthalmus maximus]KAF0035909.1 hypothetical protein F2P81_011221 [Scophthalmus maximus]